MIDPRSVPVRFSRLKNMHRSPAHYIHSLTATYDSKAMRLGSLTHHLVFGTDGWTVFAGTRRGKAWDEFAAKNKGAELYTQDEYDTARRMADAVTNHRDAWPYICPGSARVEKTISWPLMGRMCQGTPDLYDLSRLVDLKTTRCAEPEWFKREATRFHYEAQLAWYSDAVEIYEGFRPANAYIIAVESSPPYPVTVLRLTDRALEQGRKLCRLWMERLLACEAANEWPAYVQSVVDFDIPDPGDELDLDFGDEDEGEEAA